MMESENKLFQMSQKDMEERDQLLDAWKRSIEVSFSIDPNTNRMTAFNAATHLVAHTAREAFKDTPGLGEGFLMEFDLAVRRILTSKNRGAA